MNINRHDNYGNKKVKLIHFYNNFRKINKKIVLT